MREIVVVGAGLAGLRAAEHLRALGFSGRLTLVGDEPFGPYNRPPLSKQLLSGEQEPADCLIQHDLKASLTFGAAAVALDRQTRHVVLSDGRRLHYDGLVIATGCSARTMPDVDNLEGVFTLRGLADAQRIRVAMRDARHAVVVGAGFIGCEVAATLRQRGIEVTMVDVADQVMTPLGRALGDRAAALHRANGVDLRLGVGVSDFVGERRITSVRLSDGTVAPADLVLLALGARPNVSWLEGSGLDTGPSAGLRCDSHCGVLGDPLIVAAGDVAEFESADGRRVRIEHWSNAPDMAQVAAANLLRPAAEREPYRPVPTMWSDQYGTRFQTVGDVRRAAEWVVTEDDNEAGRFVAEGLNEGALVAAVGMNAVRRMLRYQLQLNAESLAASARTGQ